MRILLVVLFLGGFPTLAISHTDEELESVLADARMQVKVFEFGALIGSAQACGMTIDQAQADLWAEENIPPTFMDGMGHLSGAINSGRMQIDEAETDLEKKLLCRTSERTAREYGFID